MLKTFGRIILILLVAAVVAGGIYTLVQSGSSTNSFNPEPQFDRPTQNGSAPPADFNERDARGGSIFRLVGVFGTMLEIGAITLAVLFIQSKLSVRKPMFKNA